jgi:hypothetical protein
LRILQGPRFRIGMRDLGALGRSARLLAKNRQGDDRRVDLMAALVQTDSIAELSAEAYGRCKQFVHIRSTLRALLGRSASECSIADVIDSIAQEVGLYRDVDTIGYENLLRFIDVAARFTPLSDRAPYWRTSSPLSLESNQSVPTDLGDGQAGSGTSRIESSTDLQSGLPVGKGSTGGSRSEAELGPARSAQDSQSCLPVGKGSTGGSRSEAELGPARSAKAGDDDPLYREPPTVRSAMLSFLEYLQLVAESEDDPAEATQTGTDAVQIMSIHQAKGLEFDTVFLAGIAGTKKSSSIFPDERLPANGVTQAAVLPPWLQADGDPTVPPISHYKELKVLADAARQRANEEELRLLYVAVTRARKNLICSTGHWYPGPATAHGPSAFFDLLNDSKLFTPGKSEAAAKENPAASLRKRRLDELNEKLDRKNRSRDGFTGPLGVSTGLFGEALPATAGRTKSRRLKPLPAPLLPSGTGSVAASSSSLVSAPGSSAQGLPAQGLSAPGLSTPGLSAPGLSTPGLSIRSLPVSALGVVAVCPRKYHWTYVLPLPRRRSPAAEFGIAVHAWIESGLGTNLETSAFNAQSSNGPQPVFPASPAADTNVVTTPHQFASNTLRDQIRRNYLDTRFAGLKPTLTESAFSFTPNITRNTTVLSGRMDAVHVHDDGTVEIVDIKSGRAPFANDPVTALPNDTAVQMAAYGLLALDAWGTKADRLRTTVCYLGGDEPVLHTTIWDESIATKQRELVGTSITKAISDTSGVIPGPACSYCDYNAFCEGAAQIRAKEANAEAKRSTD